MTLRHFSFDRSLMYEIAVFIPVLICCSVMFLLTAAPLSAQVENGIDGTVMDSTGAVIAGAHVTIISTSTGFTSKAVTSSAGTFTVVGLIPGDYSVAVDAPEFKTTKTNLTVEVAKMSTLSVRMETEQPPKRVVVKEAAILLNTTSPVLGTTLEPELVRTAPIEINGLARQIDSFMYLAPGVQGECRQPQT